MHAPVSEAILRLNTSTETLVYSDHLWGIKKKGLSRELVSLRRSESIVQALLGHDQVLFID